MIGGRARAVLAALAVVLGACTSTGPDAGTGSIAGPAPDVRPFVVHSAALGRDMPALVFTPRGYDASRAYPVLYLFHGYGGNETSWLSGSGTDGVGIDAIAQGLIDAGRICPVVIVSASIGNSYGVDSGPAPDPATDPYDHGPYEQYLVRDLIPAIEAAYPGLGATRGRFVAGLSMGGFAALHLVFRHPELFAGVGALSPALFIDTPADRRWLFSGSPATQDPMTLARTADLGRLRLFLGTGASDYGWIRDATVELARRLAARGFDVRPVVGRGGHELSTWRRLAPSLLLALFPPPCGGSPAPSG